ncbi:protein mono-ADP-ribosyltransferase PARP14 [Patella vulgata]|uniref:protein mono-ADP-ribosyltransferase PARP14 n=1 Tax=Patella vulgata TaxID=6465 RepID=UPI0021803E28|nr:protein mono-ADP-ribosyltransferase PARP14 [Patella vulgata]
MAEAGAEVTDDNNCSVICISESPLSESLFPKIKLYMQNKKRSKGGKVVALKTVRNGILIEFESSEAAKGVVEKGSHKIDTHTLQARMYKPQPHYKTKLLVRDIPDEVDKFTLENYMEIITDNGVDNIQYGEDPSTAVVTFEGDIDFTIVEEQLSDNPISDNEILIVERIELSNVIKIKDVKSDTKDESLKIYFQNKRRSGGGRVVKIENVENARLIHFEDFEVAENVCKKPHTINHQDLEAEVYYECLGVDGGSTEPIVCVIPDPIDITADVISGARVMRLLLERSTVLDSLNDRLSDHLAAIGKDEDKLKISCTTTEKTKEMGRRLKSWKHDVMATLKQFIDDMIEDKIIPLTLDLNQSVAEWIRNNLKQPLHVIHKLDADNIAITGIKDAVQPLVQDLQKFIDEESKKIDRIKNLKDKEIKFTTAEMKYLKRTGNFELFAEKFPEMIMTIDKDRLCVNGTDEEISAAETMMNHVVSALKKYTTALTPDQIKILGEPCNEEDIYRTLEEKLGMTKGIWLWGNGVMNMYTSSFGDYKETENTLGELIPIETVTVDDDKKLYVKSQICNDKLEEIVKDNLTEVVIDVSDDVSTITITALAPIIQIVVKKVKDVISGAKLITESVRFPKENTERYFKENEKEELQNIESKFNVMFKWEDNKLMVSAVEQEDINRTQDYIADAAERHKELTLYFKGPGVESILHTAYENGAMYYPGTILEYKGLDTAETVGFAVESEFVINGSSTTVKIGHGSAQYLHSDVVLVPVKIDMKPIGKVGKIGFDAGPGITQTSTGMRKIPGEVIKTRPGRFYSHELIYGIYPGVNTDDKEICMSTIITNVLTHADKQGYTSVAIPCVNLNPVSLQKTIRENSYSAVEQYLADNPTSYIQTVWFYADESEDAKGFTAFAMSTNDKNTRKVKRRFRKKGREAEDTQEPAARITRMFLVVSDIISEEAGALVNSSNGELNLYYGAISRALLERCGNQLQIDCREHYKNGLKQGDIAVTNAYNLIQTKKIYHVNLPRYNEDEELQVLEGSIEKCLHQAVKDKLKNIAFPAIGSGILGYPHDKVAAKLFETVHKFGEENPDTTLTDVIFVMYHKDEKVIKAFQDKEKIYKQQYGAKVYNEDEYLKSLLAGDDEPNSRVKIGDKLPLAIYSKSSALLINIYANDSEALTKVDSKCSSIINRDINTREITANAYFKDLDDDQLAELMKGIFEKKLEIESVIDRNTGSWKTRGTANDTLVIKDIFSETKSKQEDEKAKARNLQLTRQWHFTERDTSGETLVPYDYLRNYKIEMAYVDDKKAVKIKDDDGEEYVIDFVSMTEKRILPDKTLDSAGTLVVRKTPVQEASGKPPEEWGDMKGRNLRVDNLKEDTTEYLQVKKKLFDSMSSSTLTIEKIESIKNVSLYRQYTALKKQIQAENPGILVEKQLFHGTNRDAAKSINRNGFNRSYCSEKENALGIGVYFATESAYSTRDDYSQRDINNGLKYIFLCDVVVGKSTVGKKGMRVPPNIEGKTTPYDSAVERIKDPRTFVIFKDNQAYPKYLISLK